MTQNCEFLRRQLDLRISCKAAQPPGIQTNGTACQEAAPCIALAAADERLAFGIQRGEQERLEDVIIPAEIISEQHILLPGTGGDENDRNIAAFPDAPANREAVDLRQHDVEQHQLIGQLPAGNKGECFAAVMDGMNPAFLGTEIGFDDLADL